MRVQSWKKTHNGHKSEIDNDDFAFCDKIGFKRPLCAAICDESEGRDNGARTGIPGHWQIWGWQGKSELESTEFKAEVSE